MTNAQKGVQNVKGIITDKQSDMPLIGATIYLANHDSKGAITDPDGHFIMTDVPLGRQQFEVNYLSYEPISITNIEVTSGKEVYLEIQMSESLIALEEVIITAAVDKDKSINEFATISSRQFSMEEVNRFSGGLSDVSKLVGNFAGVSTANDARNDIVIRGNSPTGLLWQLEGIPIPSPNHFSTVGTTGGPLSALNTNLLKNSDFITSAFPAEYGNALSGVFDLGFRTGNKDQVETTIQLGGSTGIEAMIEGPICKEQNSSFLVAYRYSFFGISNALGANLGTNAIPQYDDISFKFDFGKSEWGRFTLFGIGGRSDIEFNHDEIDETDLFAADDEDTRADSKFGVIGLKHRYLVNENSYLSTILGYSGNKVKITRDRYYNQNSDDEIIAPFKISDDGLTRLSLHSFYNTKYSKRLNIKAGVLLESVNVTLNQQSAEFGIDQNDDGIFDLQQVYEFDNKTLNIQPYAQAKYRMYSNLTLNAGMRGLYYNLNKSAVLEPRVALNYNLSDKQSISIGYSLHHQAIPLPIQLAVQNSAEGPILANKNLDFIRSHHLVLGYDMNIGDNWRSKVELYYQDILNVPVDKVASSYSVLNEGADFVFSLDKNDLVNNGTGQNYGVEVTIEKFFSEGYYALITGSLFESKYIASDSIERSTAFNNQYVANFLVGKEFNIGCEKQHRFSINTRVSTSGGRFYTPVDLQASSVNGIEVFDEDNAFNSRFRNYFRWDLKFGVKLNSMKRKFSHSVYFEMQNVTNNKNIFRKSYNRNTNQVNDILQIGFFPNLIYKVEF